MASCLYPGQQTSKEICLPGTIRKVAGNVDGLGNETLPVPWEKGPTKLFKSAVKHKLQELGRKEEENQLFFLKSELKKKSFLSGITKMEDNVLLTEEHIFSTMIYGECLCLFPEKYVEPFDNAR